MPAAPSTACPARLEDELGDAYPPEVRAWVRGALEADEFEELPRGLRRHVVERLGRSRTLHRCPECRTLSLWRFVEGLTHCRACAASLARIDAAHVDALDAPGPHPAFEAARGQRAAATGSAAQSAPSRARLLDPAPPAAWSFGELSLGRAVPPPPAFEAPPLRRVQRPATAAVQRATVARLRKTLDGLDAAPVADAERERLSKDPGAEQLRGLLREACLPEVREGSQHLKRGRVEAALEAFSAAIRKNPHHPQPWTKRGIVRARTGDLTGAVEDYSEALEVDRIYLPAWANRASAEFHRGNLEQTVHDATRALELAPTLAQAWLFRGIAQAKLGAATAAEDDLVHFLELSPYSPYVRLIRNTLREVEARVAG